MINSRSGHDFFLPPLSFVFPLPCFFHSPFPVFHWLHALFMFNFCTLSICQNHPLLCYKAEVCGGRFFSFKRWVIIGNPFLPSFHCSEFPRCCSVSSPLPFPFILNNFSRAVFSHLKAGIYGEPESLFTFYVL